MPTYYYTAKSFDGQTKTGVLSVKDTRQLAQALKSDGLILVKAVLEKKREKQKFETFFSFLGVSSIEKIIAVKNLQVMIASGLSLSRSLDILADQSRSRKFKKALLGVKQEIDAGKNFSEALSKYPEIFSEVFQNMIKVGEETGTLENILKILSLQMEKEKELKSKVKGALIYPIIVVATMMGIGILMLVMVAPQLSGLFKELDIELPLSTKIVISSGIILVEKWYLFVLTVCFFIFIFWGMKKIKNGKWLIDVFLMKLPVISSIIKKSNSALMMRTLSSLIASGVPINRSLEISVGTLKNVYFKEILNKAAEEVKKGEKLSNILKPYKNIFSFGTIEMIEVGEETGETTKILTKLAEFFEEEINNTTQNLTLIIEPILMIIIGTVIGFFAVSILQPMYSMFGVI